MAKTFNKILIALLVLSLPLPAFASVSVDENLTVNTFFAVNGGTLNMTATSGFLNLSGLSASLINTGANSLSLTGSPLYLNTTGTGATSIGNGATVTLSVGSDQIGDIYYRNSSNNLARLAIGTAGQVLVASGTPNWKTLATVATGTTAYSTLNWNTSTASWQENATFLANAGALSGVSSLDLIAVSSGTLAFPNAGTLSTGVGNLTLQPASGTVSLDSASNLTGNSALTISTALNPLMINSSRWTVNSSGTLVLTTSDGIYTIGEAFPNKISSTDNGIGLYNAATSTSMKSGLFTEVDGTLLSYGINVTQIGDRNATYTGGIFRFDTRAGSPYFSVKRQATGTSTEYSDIQISQAGDVGMGGWPSDSNSFPANVSILVRSSSTMGFNIRGAASQTADLQQWQDKNGTELLGVDSSGTLSTSAGTALNITSGGTGAINIGTDANAKTITIGNNTGTTTIDLNTGTGKVRISGTKPTAITPATGCTGGGVVSVLANSTDNDGMLQVTTCTAGGDTSIGLTFSAAWPTIPFCVFAPANANAATIFRTANSAYVTAATGTLIINFQTQTPTTAASWTYHCFGN
jgi:hypothetical protein